jgi:hypothetical protein
MSDVQTSSRLIAFLVDCLVFLALAILLLLPLIQLDPDRVRIGTPLPEFGSASTVRTVGGQTTAEISGTWISATCVTPRPVPDALLSAITPHKAERVLLCSETFLGLGGGHIAHVDYYEAGPTQTGMQGNTRITVSRRGAAARYSVTTNEAGVPLRALFPVGLLTFVLMWLVAAKGWPTPGKLITGIRVARDRGTCRLCRETRRLAPFLVAGLFALVTGLFDAEIAASATLAWAILAAQLSFWLFAIWYYAVPLLSDAGRARYDAATGFRVVLA